jgi:integrase
MKSPSSRKKSGWPKKVSCGRISVSVYRRGTPVGGVAYMVANYSERKRRFDCYPTEEKALEEAAVLARHLSERDVMAASLTNDEAIEFASAKQTLAPFNLSISAAAATIAECLKIVGSVGALQEAIRFYSARHKRTTKKPVRGVVEELLKIKESRGASPRYLQDLKYRLNRLAGAFLMDTCDVSTPQLQEWLDAQELSPQGYSNFRRVIHLFFEFAVARGYASDNPAASVETVKVRAGEIEIFTPSEIARLLAAASNDFRPCLALGAFSGLRSAEIERLQWNDVDLASRHIVIGASRAKTASRRIIPICDNLAAWLAPYARKQGAVWPGLHDAFYDEQLETARRTAVSADLDNGVESLPDVKWKSNGLRHSYASYRFAQIADAGRVAAELGNSAAVVHRHYRELVKPADAAKWFSIAPEPPPT